MKKAVTIYILLIVLFCSSALAQTETKFDTAFINTSSVAFFKANSSIDKIRLVTSGKYLSFIDIYTTTNGLKSNSQEEFKRYGFQSLPDIYALLKEYGIPNLPEKEISIATKNRWFSNYSLDAAVSSDSIHLSFLFYSPEQLDNPEEKIFIKVVKPRGYVGGVKKMKEDVEAEIKNKKINLSKNIEDSALAYKMILGKDSSILEATLIHGNQSGFSQTIQDFLIKLKPWNPFDAGGRPAKSYLNLFIRLHSDKSLTIYYPE